MPYTPPYVYGNSLENKAGIMQRIPKNFFARHKDLMPSSYLKIIRNSSAFFAINDERYLFSVIQIQNIDYDSMDYHGPFNGCTVTWKYLFWK